MLLLLLLLFCYNFFVGKLSFDAFFSNVRALRSRGEQRALGNKQFKPCGKINSAHFEVLSINLDNSNFTNGQY